MPLPLKGKIGVAEKNKLCILRAICSPNWEISEWLFFLMTQAAELSELYSDHAQMHLYAGMQGHHNPSSKLDRRNLTWQAVGTFI